MSYKTILVHLDRESHAKERIRIACQMAIAQDAFLIGAAMVGVSTLTFQQAHIDEKDPVIASHLRFLHDRAGTFVKEFEEQAKKMGVPSFEGRIVDGEANQGISLLSRFADLVVIGQTDLHETSPVVAPDFPEYVMMNAGRPVLIVPSSFGKEVGKRVMICWNASREATRAVADTIPVLRRADVVQIAMFNIDKEPDVNAEHAGHDLAVYLARHGINVEVLPPQVDKNIGSAVLALAQEQSCDLLVMGGYGHTRFREFLLGGVTRTVLGDATMPVLMSH